MTSTGNQHCANCIGTLSFPILQPAQMYITERLFCTVSSVLICQKLKPTTCKTHSFLRHTSSQMYSRKPNSLEVSSLCCKTFSKESQGRLRKSFAYDF